VAPAAPHAQRAQVRGDREPAALITVTTNQKERTLVVNKIRVWRRLGVVISVLWFIGFFVWTWNNEDEENALGRKIHADYCIAESGPGGMFGPHPDRPASEMDRRYACFKGFHEHKSPFDVVLINDLLLIALAWLLAWITIRVGRWVMAPVKFTSSTKNEKTLP
jgi:hypothetical protein